MHEESCWVHLENVLFTTRGFRCHDGCSAPAFNRDAPIRSASYSYHGGLAAAAARYDM